MTFTVTRTSDCEYEKMEVKINTLEELLDFCNKNKEKIIIFPTYNWLGKEMRHIEIYDDYRE